MPLIKYDNIFLRPNLEGAQSQAPANSSPARGAGLCFYWKMWRRAEEHSFSQPITHKSDKCAPTQEGRQGEGRYGGGAVKLQILES